MSDFSFQDSQNPKIHCLHQKASLLAASSLANSTKSNYGKAWVRFLHFCYLMGLIPMATSGQDIADWLVYRSEHTKSPNVAEALLMGLLKAKEAKSLLHLGLEPQMV